MNDAPEGALDPATVRSFVAMIHEAAARALNGAPDPGMLQLSFLHPRGASMVPTRFAIGAVEAMADSAISAASNGLNVYVEGRTVDARASGRGRAGDTRGVFAFVNDSDGDKGKAGALPIAPTWKIESSPGNRHDWILLERALTADEAEPLGRALRAWIGSDSATAKLTQPYRVAGTPNYPNAKKQARGRTVTPTRILSIDGPVWSAVHLAEMVPPTSDAPGTAALGGRSGRSSDTVEGIAAEPGDDRSGQFFRAIVKAIEAGMLSGDVEDVFRRNPNGCASKYLKPHDRLAGEIERAWPKAAAKLAENASRPKVDPTYPDRRVPVEEARAAVRKALEDHFAAGEECCAIKTSTGVGKTIIAAEVIAVDVKRRRAAGDKRATVYAVPTHKLGGEVEALFMSHGITARVYRGRAALDPDAADVQGTMCLDMEMVKIAQDLGEPVATSCCRGKHPISGEMATCRLFYDCSYQGQLRATPDVWIVPHQLLFHAQSALGKVAGVVIDEGFWQAGLAIGKKGLTLDGLGAEPSIKAGSLDLMADVAGYRARLARALRRQANLGGVERRHLVAEGIDAELCARALKSEWKLKDGAEIWPGMGDTARRKASAAGALALRVRAYAAAWNAARDLVRRDDPDTVSGRLVLGNIKTAEGMACGVRVNRLRPIVKALADVPTLIMDATLPDIAILRSLYPDVVVVAEIEAAMPHARVRQVVGAPVSANKLMRPEAGRNREAVRRAILLRFIATGRGPTLVIAQKDMAEWLRTAGLPDPIETAHFNAIAGLDGFKAVRLLIVIGRTLPNILAIEDEAGAVTGIQGKRTVKPANGPRWYNRVTLGLRLADGTAYPVQGDRHPDPIAEAIRWQAAEAEVMQAIGRARGVNRTAANPVNIELWNDLALPLTIDEVTSWDDVPAGYEADMLADGIVLDSPSDMAKCWPKVWKTPEAARRWLSRTTSGQNPIGTTSGQNPMKNTLYRNLPACAFRYRHPGERQKWRQGWHDPAVCLDPRMWLEVRLGALADFETITGK